MISGVKSWASSGSAGRLRLESKGNSSRRRLAVTDGGWPVTDPQNDRAVLKQKDNPERSVTALAPKWPVFGSWLQDGLSAGEPPKQDPSAANLCFPVVLAWQGHLCGEGGHPNWHTLEKVSSSGGST